MDLNVESIFRLLMICRVFQAEILAIRKGAEFAPMHISYVDSQSAVGTCEYRLKSVLNSFI